MGLRILIDTDAATTSDGVYLFAGDSIVSSGLGSGEAIAIEHEVKSGVWEPVYDHSAAAVELTPSKPDITISAYSRYRAISTGTAADVTVSAFSPSF